MWWHNLLCIFIGVGSGFVAAGGVFVLLTVVGIVTKLAERTHTAKYICLYETVLIIGSILGNIVSIYEINLYGGNIFMVLYGLFSGAFVGCLAICLGESLKVTSICNRRFSVNKGIISILISVMLGKIAGSLIYYFIIS
ncbi:MAG: stage V sporulation protein AB [Lachnospiraceae bacterium]|nr:stage V sporulation protein AB [Lachnospiraceae bacterium]MBQ4067789.1 stage V sporulation protein AB [Lachnospiraceae bacterium]